jgi:hypothetical protein
VKRPTQMERVRNFMLRGEEFGGGSAPWRTLGEIARVTRYPEASVSAQLRHLRKQRFGGYRVKKRLRRSDAGEREIQRGPTWEYRVLRGA